MHELKPRQIGNPESSDRGTTQIGRILAAAWGLNPKAPAWTPGPSSSGDRRGDSLGRIRRAVHGVGTHKSVDGAETLGVGGLNLPMKKNKHRANLYSQRVQQAIHKKTNKKEHEETEEGPGWT